MAPPSSAQKQSRRRKKRRTQDSSSESSSDSSDHSDSETKPLPLASETAIENKPNYDIDDIDIESDQEKDVVEKNKLMPEATLKQMETIKFTTTDNIPLAEAKDQIKRDRLELESKFLAEMATTFANELDELRQKPDFSEKSIVLLAKTLQSGSNMFDEETLEALLTK